eukprot:CAMPEP_0119009732 /NCGR_PEP_ID=MMETSP1176-20130426/4569_1 /TAXON_ID=265551 /ORGANISM="Synedropsis recta cf, Strain CCMP1620" /LENGTH=402 /DNA_ID=CAMNT_0006962301 /DNA_START=18 /DNA_END=1223 /DNA_ORIENTATION=-
MTEPPSSAASDADVPIFASKYDTDVSGTKTFASDGGSTEWSYATNGSSDIVSNASTFASRTSIATTDEEEYHVFNRMVDNFCSCVDDIGDVTNVCRTEDDTREKPSLLYRSNHGRHSTKLQKRNKNISFIKQFATTHKIKMPNDRVDGKPKRVREKHQATIASKGSALQQIRSMVSIKSKKSGMSGVSGMSGKSEKSKQKQRKSGEGGSNKRGKKKHRRKKKKEGSIKKEDPILPPPLDVVLESPKFDESSKTPVHGHRHRTPTHGAALPSPSANDKTPKASCSTKPLVPTSVEAESAPPVSPRDSTASLLRAARSRSKSPPKSSKSLTMSMLTGSAQASPRKEPRSPASIFPKKSPRAPSKSIVMTSISPPPSISAGKTTHRPITSSSSPSPSRADKKAFW